MYSEELICVNLLLEHFYGPFDDKTKFISFIIDTEKDGFVPALESSAKNEICYITIFRINKNSERLLESVPQNLKNVSGDSAIVIGKEFFTEFTLAKEQENV